ncbi:hypothetical protein NECAME_15931 [Necator americanus]|uniref:Uncharacterized protein n=1 Tax=Necator americanus TaxID=51031 RepID=W2SF96_NECAM|nr:hypothetical protein NECAME_15931 [Necator americanus]ETN68245.1 hypothetical protein NECAME_15931 [Necator americanus]
MTKTEEIRLIMESLFPMDMRLILREELRASFLPFATPIDVSEKEPYVWYVKTSPLEITIPFHHAMDNNRMFTCMGNGDCPVNKEV